MQLAGLAEEADIIKINPARLVRQRKEDNGRVRYLLDAEETALRAIIAKSYSEHSSEFEVALMTGMRQSEQFERSWEDIDLNQNMVRLPQTKNGKCRFVRPIAVLWRYCARGTIRESVPEGCSLT